MYKFYKLLLFLIGSLLIVANVYGQKSQGIGTDKPNSRAVLDITVESPSTFPQGLLLPRLTTVQRNALGTVAGLAAGMAVFDSNDLKFYIWNGSWVAAGTSNITTITGTNIATVTTITGGYNIDVPIISIVGINGLVVTSAGASFSISGQNLGQWSNTTSGILYNSGNIAIGTNTDPTQGKLVIVQDAGIIPAIVLSGGGGAKSVNLQFARNGGSDGGIGIAGVTASFSGIAAAGDMIMRAEAGSLILSAKNAGGDIKFATGATDTEKMRITNTGKVGIGAAPGIGSPQLIIQGNTSTSGALFSNSLTINSLSVSGSVLTVDGLGNVGMGALPSANGTIWTLSGNNILPQNQNYTLGLGTIPGIANMLRIYTTVNGEALLIENNNTSGGTAIHAITNDGNSSGAAIIGENMGPGNGIMGITQNTSTNAAGVFGLGGNGGGNAYYGVSGYTYSTNVSGAGIYGSNNTGGIGVKGIASGTSGFGVRGEFATTSGLGFGIYGVTNSTTTGSSAIYGSAPTGGFAAIFNGHSSISGTQFINSLRINALSVSGSVLTVDGLGNVGMGTISAGASQWTTTTTGIYANTFVGIGSINPTSPLHVQDIYNGPGGRTSVKFDIVQTIPNQNNRAIQLNYSVSGNGALMVFTGFENNITGNPFNSSSNTMQAYSALVNVAGTGHVIGYQSSIGGSNTGKKTGFDANVQGTGGSQNIGINVIVSGATNNYAALLNGGNVGIGTTAPTTMLDVAGGVRFENLSIAGSVLTVDGLGNLGMGTIGNGISGSGQTNGVAFFTSTNSLTANGTNFNWSNSSLNMNGVRVFGTVSGFTSSFVVGSDAATTNYSGTDNNIIGYKAGHLITSGYSNNFLGNSAGYNNSVGYGNNFFGLNTGYNNTSGSGNNFIGYGAGSSNTSGSNNNFIGQSGLGNTTGTDNNFFGTNAGAANTIGSYNNAFGVNSGLSNVNGFFNNFIGFGAGSANTSGGQNNFFGKSAGATNMTGSYNIAIGYQADVASNNLINAVAIGTSATVGGSNMMALGGTGVNAVNVGIGTGNPSAALHVVGGARITNLSIAGSVLTVDGLGNVGMGIISAGSSQWLTTTGGIYTNTAVGIGVNTFTGHEALRIGGYNPASPKGFVFPYITTVQMAAITVAGLGPLDAGMGFYVIEYKDVTIWDGTKFSNTGGSNNNNNNSPGYNWDIYGSISISGTTLSATGFGRLGTMDYSGLMLQTNSQSRMFIPASTLAGITIGIGNFSQTVTSALSVKGDIGLGDGTSTNNGNVIVWLTNSSGSTLTPGTIVVVGASDDSFNTTVTASDNSVIGVLTENCSVGNSCKVAVSGVVTVSVNGGSTRGQHCVTSIVSGQALSVPVPNVGASIGVFLQTTAGTSARVLLR